MFKDKNILVTGGTGMIGRYLVEDLIRRGGRVTVVSLDDPSRAHPQAEFKKANLMQFDNCLEVARGMDYVFHLAGIKGSPAVTTKRPASFFVPTITFNTNMMEAARQAGVERYLFSSSVGVYSPAELFCEDDVWQTFPSKNDKFAGWAKRMGELQAEAYAIEYGWEKISIVRPANVYGPYDNFDSVNAMVIPSLIRRAVEGENPFTVWGDGSAVRDFIHAKDVAGGMIFAMENNITEPLNLGSGKGVSIRDLADIIVNNLEVKPKIVWDVSKPGGDRKRLLDMSRACKYGFKPSVSLAEGIKETMEWFRSNRQNMDKHYNVFTEGVKYSD